MESNEIPYRDFYMRAQEFLKELKRSKLLTANKFKYIEIHKVPIHKELTLFDLLHPLNSHCNYIWKFANKGLNSLIIDTYLLPTGRLSMFILACLNLANTSSHGATS